MKNIYCAIILFAFGFGSVAYAQNTETPDRSMGEHKYLMNSDFAKMEHGNIQLQDVVDTTPKRPFDVISYKLLLDWRKVFQAKNQLFNGTNEITIKVTNLTDSIVLDAAEMRIDTFWMNGQMMQNPPQPDANQILTIPLISALRDSTKLLVLKFAYSRTSLANDGMYFYPKGLTSQGVYSHITDTVAEDLAYTMSEPLDAHKWMPCMDLPYQKAASQIAIIVPVGFSAQSNGILDSTIENNDYSTTYYWRSDKPISTYLMCATASRWVNWTAYYHRLANPNDSIPVTYYAWAEDYNSQGAYDAQSAVQKTPLMIKAFSERFGEYPYMKYGQVFVAPFAYGGMEHQTISLNQRGWLLGREEDGIAHELMHQWFGDKTTCETFADIWLNEGYAIHGEGIWQEAEYGKAAYDYTMAWYARGYFVDGGENQIPIYNPPIANVFDYATTYCKAGCVLYMLRKVVNNDTLFFNAHRDYLTHFAFSTANTAQWVDFMSRRLGIDLTEYADEWLYNPGHPIYKIGWGQHSGNALEVLVTQQQTVRDHFTMPLEFSVYHGSSIDTEHVVNNARVQSFKFNLPYTADSVQFDSSCVVVSLHTLYHDNALSVNPLAVSNSLLHLQLQSESGTIACHYTPLQHSGTLELYNMLGEKLYASEVSAGSSAWNIPTANLASAAYLVRLQTSDAMAVQRIGVVR